MREPDADVHEYRARKSERKKLGNKREQRLLSAGVTDEAGRERRKRAVEISAERQGLIRLLRRIVGKMLTSSIR